MGVEGGGGGSEILRPLEFDVNSRLCSVLNVGGIRNSESLRIGENSRFCSVLSDGGSEILSPLESV